MSFWRWLRSLFSRRRDERPIVSLVLLLRRPRSLGLESLAAAIRRALGVEVWTGVDEPRGNYYILEEVDPSFIVQLGKQTFLVNNFPVPYMSDPIAEAAEIPELRLQRAVAEHRAWLSVDLLRNDRNERTLDGEEIHAAYRTIGPLIAELADDDTLALLEPETGLMNVYGSGLDDELRGPDPRQALTGLAHVPVIAIKDDDPRMIAAVDQARGRWPEFVTAFENRRPGQVFSVKVRLADENAVEYMWISVTALEGDYLYGKLDNEPVGLRQVRLGSRIRSLVSEINDWTFLEGKTLRGGFTIEVLRRAKEEWS